MKNKKEAIANWVQFKNIPCDDQDCITQPFLDFEIGTNKFTIYMWFEKEYQCDVVEQLILMTEI